MFSHTQLSFSLNFPKERQMKYELLRKEIVKQHIMLLNEKIAFGSW